MGLPIDLSSVRWWTRLAPLGAFYVVRRLAGPRIAVLARGPGAGHVLFKVCLWLGLRVHHDASAEGAAIVGDGGTHLTRQYPPHAWNARCRDISKVTVQRLFEAAFGYPLGVDPAAHRGPMVEKSDINALHDGRVVDGPLPPAPGKVYSRVVDNLRGDEAEDLRTAVVRGEIACVYLKRRPATSRFSNTNRSVALASSPAAIFSASERDAILRLADAIGLDFGEMDILRDRTDGRIYVVDVNRTPAGPPNGIGWLDHYRAIRRIARAFRAAMLRDARRR
ncbi:MAG: hypothetical protein ACWA6X_10330 [Bauldia sp.]